MKAPQITNLVLIKLAANFAYFAWDSLGGNVLYRLEYMKKGSSWTQLPSLLTTNEYFFDFLEKNTTYKIRITTIVSGFDDSDMVESEEFMTFDTNAFTITKMAPFDISYPLIQNKFVNNDKSYFDFNTELLMASLMSSRFIYDNKIEYQKSYSNYLLSDAEHHEILGEIQEVCKDVNRVCPVYVNGVIYLFEKFQHIANISNDKTQNWFYYNALSNRAGNPVSRTIAYQNENTTFVLGYDRIFAARDSYDVRWSSDVNRFSSKLISFVDQNPYGVEDVGFPVSIFNTFAILPSTHMHLAEAISCDNDYAYVAGRNTLRRISINDPERETDPDSSNFGQRIWDPEIFPITTNNYSVCKKLDILNNELYALITGTAGDDIQGYLDPTIPENVIDSDTKGIYWFDKINSSWIRVYGNTEEERIHITHSWTDMSTNGKELFFDYDKYSMSILPDTELPTKNPDVNMAVKYKFDKTYGQDKLRHLITLRTTGISDNSIVWNYKPQGYYAESKFSWMYKETVRIWINNQNQVVIVYPNKHYVIDLDKPVRHSKEVWDHGECSVYGNDIYFNNVRSYASGILIYGKYSNKIVGFYKFDFPIAGDINVVWTPTERMFLATLDNQLTEQKGEITPETGLMTPDITPLMVKMGPDTYFDEQQLYTKFILYYLEFISKKTTSHYSRLVNLIKNKYNREVDAIDFLWSEIGKRNIYLDSNKKEMVTRFFETRASDFYSSKGTIDSYKFLFKVLYNEDIEVEVESEQSIEYTILITSDNISDEILGTPVFTKTGRANVLSYKKVTINNEVLWQLIIHNIYGKFNKGQELKQDTSDFTGILQTNIVGQLIPNTGEDYFNTPSYSTIKIISNLTMDRYQTDVMRFVHPTGYGLIGILLMTLYIKGGISIQHKETIVEIMKTYRWDAGVSLEYPLDIPDLDNNGNIQFDDQRNIITKPNPMYGTDPLIFWPNYDTDEEEYFGLLPSERRVKWSPSFDASWARFSNFKDMTDLRLKDNAGNPRDPKNPTQIKVNK